MDGAFESFNDRALVRDNQHKSESFSPPASPADSLQSRDSVEQGSHHDSPRGGGPESPGSDEHDTSPPASPVADYLTEDKNSSPEGGRRSRSLSPVDDADVPPTEDQSDAVASVQERSGSRSPVRSRSLSFSSARSRSRASSPAPSRSRSRSMSATPAEIRSRSPSVSGRSRSASPAVPGSREASRSRSRSASSVGSQSPIARSRGSVSPGGIRSRSPSHSPAPSHSPSESPARVSSVRDVRASADRYNLYLLYVTSRSLFVISK